MEAVRDATRRTTEVDPTDTEPIPAGKTCAEIFEEQARDDFCQTVFSTQLGPKPIFFEYYDSVLYRTYSRQVDMIHFVLPSSLRGRTLLHYHYYPIAVHPGHTRLHRLVARVFKRPQQAAYAAHTVRECVPCVKNIVRFSKKVHTLILFPVEGPLELVSIGILGSLPRSKPGFVFILFISVRFTKLTQAVPFIRIKSYVVYVLFTEHWAFTYGPPNTLLSNNGLHFVAHFFQHVFQILQMKESCISTYHSQCNG